MFDDYFVEILFLQNSNLNNVLCWPQCNECILHKTNFAMSYLNLMAYSLIVKIFMIQSGFVSLRQSLFSRLKILTYPYVCNVYCHMNMVGLAYTIQMTVNITFMPSEQRKCRGIKIMVCCNFEQNPTTNTMMEGVGVKERGAKNGLFTIFIEKKRFRGRIGKGESNYYFAPRVSKQHVCLPIGPM